MSETSAARLEWTGCRLGWKADKWSDAFDKFLRRYKADFVREGAGPLLGGADESEGGFPPMEGSGLMTLG